MEKNLDFSIFSDEEILEHFNHRCQICGSSYGVQIHHLKFRSQGGVNNERLPLCSRCHTRYHSEGGFRERFEKKLYDIAGTFYFLRINGVNI